MIKLNEYLKLDDRIESLYNRVRAELISTGKEEVWNHTKRVINNLYKISEEISFKFKPTLIAAIVHDLGYNEVIKGHEKASVMLITPMLNKMYDHNTVSTIIHCVESHEAEAIKPQTIEAEALHDADMMDYAGNKGIINAFLIGKDLGLSAIETTNRVLRVITEGFINKKIRKKYEEIITSTKRFYNKLMIEINNEKQEMNKHGII